MEANDEDSDLITAARNASGASTQRWNSKKTTLNARRGVTTTSAMSPSLNRRDSTASPNNDQNQVQFINTQSTLMTSLPAHLVLDDRPNRYCV